MVALVSIFTALLGLLACQWAAGQENCYAYDMNPYLYFSTKTSYNHVKNLDRNPINLPGCTPAQMWMFSRHGTNYPKNDDPDALEMQALLDNMPIYQAAVLQNHRENRGYLCGVDLENIRQWTTANLPLDREEKLAPAGQDEWLNVGDRYRDRFPGLLQTYNANNHIFRYTTASRSEKSCNWFARGVWGKSVSDAIKYPDPIENDPLIRFYKVCTKWLVEVENNPETWAEREAFMNGPEAAAMVADVNNRLGYYDAVPTRLTLTDVRLIAQMCAVDKSLDFNFTSPWCAAFSESNLLVLEYINELESYYQDGYAYDINVEQACNPVVDLYNYFNSIVSGAATSPLGIFYFSHHPAISKLEARFGLFRDQVPLTATNFAAQQGRQWRSSKHVNFASNMAFVLFKCESNSYKVQLYVQEKLTRLPGCVTETCLWDEFVDIVRPIVATCDFDKICENTL